MAFGGLMSDQALDLRARTLHKLLPTPELCRTIRWMAASAHPTAKLIKRLQFTRETINWKDIAGVTEMIYIAGPSLRECTLDDDGRPVLFPVSEAVRMVNDWWPSSFHCRRDSIGDDFRDYWDYQPHEHAVAYRRQ